MATQTLEGNLRKKSLLADAAPVAHQLVGLILIVSAVLKALRPTSFLIAVSLFTWIPIQVREWLPLVVSFIELWIAFGIFFPKRSVRSISLLAALVFFTGATGFQIWRFLRHPETDCACFGDVIVLDPLVAIVFDLFLVWCCVMAGRHLRSLQGELS